MIGLIDCNSFYASCEKVFRPDLKDRPVVVLSNNDGCIVAMSKEAKAIDIPRGQPYYKCKEILEKTRTVVFSSNYTLYQDLSNRIMDIIAQEFPSIEVYSIDECFVFPNMESNESLEEFSIWFKAYIEQCTGIPVSIGFGRTRTLAKLANGWAKKRTKTGVFLLTPEKEQAILSQYPVASVWGIGSAKAAYLLSKGVKNAYDFSLQDDATIKKALTLPGLYTLWELRGKPAFNNETKPVDKKGICSGISFSSPKRSKAELLQALTCHVMTAATKLNAQNSVCSVLTIHISSNRFKDYVYYGRQSYTFDQGVNYPSDLIHGARLALDQAFKPGQAYVKAAVILTGIEKRKNQQHSLFVEEEDLALKVKKQKVLEACTNMRTKYGKASLGCGVAGIMDKSELMRQDHLSPSYTTQWQQLPFAR